jgi:uncharacterized protein YcfL
MKKFFIGCVAMLSLVSCSKDEKSAETQAADIVSQDSVVDVASDATEVAVDATEAVDAGASVSPTEEATPSK